MTVMRWFLGGSAALFACLWVAFFLFANSFRRSWGASANELWTGVLPIVVALLVLFSVLMPEEKILLYATACVVTIVCIACLWIVSLAPFLSAVWFAYAGLWIAFLSCTCGKIKPKTTATNYLFC